MYCIYSLLNAIHTPAKKVIIVLTWGADANHHQSYFMASIDDWWSHTFVCYQMHTILRELLLFCHATKKYGHNFIGIPFTPATWATFYRNSVHFAYGNAYAKCTIVVNNLQSSSIIINHHQSSSIIISHHHS